MIDIDEAFTKEAVLERTPFRWEVLYPVEHDHYRPFLNSSPMFAHTILDISVAASILNRNNSRQVPGLPHCLYFSLSWGGGDSLIHQIMSGTARAQQPFGIEVGLAVGNA